MGTTGVVLAGGRSRRFGKNKLFEPIDGRPMIDHVIESLSPLVDEVIISTSTNGDETHFEGFRIVRDLTTDIGPLAGIQSAFSATHADWLLIVAGDMPRLSTLSLQSLLSLRKPEIQAILARDEEGRIHPLVGCYHRSVQPAVRQCIEEHVFAVKALISQIEKIEYVTLPTEDLANINRPGDLATYR